MLAIVVSVFCACGDEPTAPGTAGIHIVRGPPTVGTAQAIPPELLVVLVRGQSGNALPSVAVEFRATRAPDSVPTMWVAGAAFDRFLASRTETTNADGEAAVRVRYGTRAGPGAIVIRVPLLGAADTVDYTIEP